jgi:sugar phosphate isomerase/epimerase
MTDMPIALQLYTIRDETARDFPGALRRVAEIGYNAVEFAGYGGLSSDAMVALLGETHLRAAATHVDFTRLQSDLDREIGYCKTIGCSFLVLPSLPAEQRNPTGVSLLAPWLNDVGRRCQESGIAFAYHNHNFEFDRSEGVHLLDHLLDATDPALVSLEFDVYWAAYAGVDPAAYLRTHASRMALVHLKDMAQDRDFAEVGAGTLDMPAILAASREAGVAWLIVENDRPRIPSLESARRSLEYLSGAGS